MRKEGKKLRPDAKIPHMETFVKRWKRKTIFLREPIKCRAHDVANNAAREKGKKLKPARKSKRKGRICADQEACAL